MKTQDSFSIAPNDPKAIRKRFAEQHLSWWPVIAFLPARFCFAFLAEAVTAGILWALGVPHPWQTSAGWWMVYGTLTDIGCLSVLVWLTRREGIRIRDLLGFQRERLGHQLKYAPGYLLAFVPVIALTYLLSGLFYGSQQPPQVTVIHLPLWASISSVLVWPVIWGFTEEVVYLGYLLPRMEVITGRTWRAGLIVVLFWGIQHFVIPFIPDAKYLISRYLIATVTVGGMTLIFLLWRRRMVPAIIVHYVSDVGAALLAALLLHG
jgi:membrane protease YdiL (CAAX protease family)